MSQRSPLIDQWQALFGRPPPLRWSTQRLQRDIEYVEQVNADPQLMRIEKLVNKQLNQLARKQPKSPQNQSPGTRLLREWGGTTHEVTITADNFLYQGRSYRSLTAIALDITGTRWSGPRFFGLS